MSDGGKGSKPRPFSVDQDQFIKNWDLIFGKKNEKDAKQTSQTSESSEPGGMDVSGLQEDTNR
jgi:hypothetical protein